MAQLIAFPVTTAAFVLLAWPVRFAVEYVRSATYVELLDDPVFLVTARKALNDFSYDGHKVEVDNQGPNMRLAFDREGYVVRSGAFVYDQDSDLEMLTKTKEIEMFGYNLSRCRSVRTNLYYCSFT
ncbi:MAG: hypothetical protein ABJ360_15245 [Roseobacter sp.]